MKPFALVKSPLPLISSSMASASLVAHIMYNKFVLSLPLYRQAKHYNREELSRQNMSSWLMSCAFDYIYPIYKRIKGKLFGEQVLYVDETAIKIVKEEGRIKQSNSCFLVFRASPSSPKPLVLLNYSPSGTGDTALEFLQGSSCKYLYADGFSGCNKLASESVIMVGSWAHMRRHWAEAHKALSVERRKKSPCRDVLVALNEIFAMERQFSSKGLKPEERLKERLEHVKPLSDKLFLHIETLQENDSKLHYRAKTYSMSQKAKLCNVFVDGRLELFNGEAERTIRAVVVGRKNWLLCDSDKGVCACEIMYSFFETAKENGLNPEKYLAYVFERMPAIKEDEAAIDELVPWSETLSKHLRMSPGEKEELQAAVAEAIKVIGTEADVKFM
jgi:hypothetical protein